MGDSLRMLTYNVQCRSWAMEVGADKALPPSETVEDRAKMISANILASRHDYDVVCLNEVFDEDGREIFVSELLGRFPYAITKADFGNVEVAWPGKPIIPINPAAMFLAVTGAGLLGSWASLGTPKLEDSGLMLFSRWPFGLRPLDEQVANLLNPFALSELTPIGFPEIGFLPYDDSTDNDAWAAKGMVYARIERSGSQTYHVFASHTQADSKDVSEHEDERREQFVDVAEFVRDAVGGEPSGEAIFLLGDFNILGGQEANPVYGDTQEWDQRFSTPGGLLTDRLVDVWGREQCTGVGPPPFEKGLRDPGYTAPVVYGPPEQRLDYVFRHNGHDLVAQHVYVDYELATVPPGVDGVSYLSDHRPLGSDFFPDRADNTPNRPFSALANPHFSHASYLLPGQVRWYRFDVNGTYEFRVMGDDIHYEVYLDTDLSRPRQQYRDEVHPDYGHRFVIPSAPFLVKVYCGDRNREVSYEFRAHRHTGVSREDAIDLVPGNSYHEAFPAGALLNTDDGSTPWNDDDTKWFRLDTVRVPVNGPMKLEIDVALQDHSEDGATLHLAIDEGGGPMLTLVGQDGPSAGTLSFSWDAKHGQRFFVTVQRRNVAGNPLSFDIMAKTSVTMILGGTFGMPQLMCEDETSGWGSDDIAAALSADGVQVCDISNDEIGDMDQDDVRDLGQWIPAHVAYTTGAEVTVIEEDDTSPDDVGTHFIPVLPDGPLARGDIAPGVRIHTVNPDQSARVVVSVDVDDGRYELRCTLTRWHEQA